MQAVAWTGALDLEKEHALSPQRPLPRKRGRGGADQCFAPHGGKSTRLKPLARARERGWGEGIFTPTLES